MHRVIPFLVASLLATSALIGSGGMGEVIGRRGDANNDNAVNVSDIAFLTDYLYSGGSTPPCLEQADVNDDSTINLSDAVYLSNWLYAGGAAPPAPGPYNPNCDRDTTAPFLGCVHYYCK